MKYLNLLNSKDALVKISKENLSVKEAVKLSRLIKNVEAELKLFDEQRIKIFEKYGKPNDDGDYMVNQSDVEKVNTEINELLSIETENEYNPIVIKSDIKISAEDIIMLDGFVEFDLDE